VVANDVSLLWTCACESKSLIKYSRWSRLLLTEGSGFVYVEPDLVAPVKDAESATKYLPSDVSRPVD
jgi:hypothetical protein